MEQIKTVVRTDELRLLIVGIRRALDLYYGQLDIRLSDGELTLGDQFTGEVCQVKLSENVTIK